MHFPIKKYKFILTLAFVVSLVSYSGFATASVPYQAQTELIISDSEDYSKVISFVQFLKQKCTTSTIAYFHFDFNCFLTDYDHRNNTKSNVFSFNYNNFKVRLAHLKINSNIRFINDHIKSTS